MNGTNAGKYRTRVQIRRLKSSLTPDAAGQINETTAANWETYIKRWAEIITKGSREFLVGDQQNAQITHLVRVRSDSDTRAALTGMRLEFDGRILSIAEPPRDRDEQRIEVEFACVEVK